MTNTPDDPDKTEAEKSVLNLAEAIGNYRLNRNSRLSFQGRQQLITSLEKCFATGLPEGEGYPFANDLMQLTRPVKEFLDRGVQITAQAAASETVKARQDMMGKVSTYANYPYDNPNYKDAATVLNEFASKANPGFIDSANRYLESDARSFIESFKNLQDNILFKIIEGRPVLAGRYDQLSSSIMHPPARHSASNSSIPPAGTTGKKRRLPSQAEHSAKIPRLTSLKDRPDPAISASGSTAIPSITERTALPSALAPNRSISPAPVIPAAYTNFLRQHPPRQPSFAQLSASIEPERQPPEPVSHPRPLRPHELPSRRQLDNVTQQMMRSLDPQVGNTLNAAPKSPGERRRGDDFGRG